jgi:hypothetical protein
MQKRSVFLSLTLLSVLLSSVWINRLPVYAQSLVTLQTGGGQPLVINGDWQPQKYDLVYTVAVSSQQQPNGPLEVYRTSATDQRHTVQIASIERSGVGATPLFFPSTNGQYLALLTPLHNSPDNAALSVISTESGAQSLLVAQEVAAADKPIWSADGQMLFYHKVVQQDVRQPGADKHYLKGGMRAAALKASSAGMISYDEIRSVDLRGHVRTLMHRIQNDSSLRMVGMDSTGGLILTLARPQQPVALIRMPGGNSQIQDGNKLTILMTLPSDILPGNVLRIGSDGTSVECERVLKWRPLIYTTVRISFAGGAVAQIEPAIDTSQPAPTVVPLNHSADGKVDVTAQVLSIRRDLAAQGIPNVPAQEALILANKKSGSMQKLILRPGEQIVQTFWARHIPLERLPRVPMQLHPTFPISPEPIRPAYSQNASPAQQDEWMLEAHAGILADAPVLPRMCYGTCPQGANGAPHVSAAIMHGVAFAESGWHQFNTGDCCVYGQAAGTPIKSFDGGWGEFQQTWAMPPQCNAAGNCRSDASRIINSQSYNIGTGAQSLISAWGTSPGVSSKSATNDPYKANHWFFAVWAYNGSYGNNPNDVASSVYGHWYPGAAFRSIYEESVWYYAAHPQRTTDNYLPSLGSGLLPPQSDFVNTADGFVACGTCYILDWTSGSYDREWVGQGVDARLGAYFRSAFTNNGGEDAVGLPRDNGGGAGVHHWGGGWLQDFGGGVYQPGALMLADGTTTPYWVFGGVWSQYLGVDRGANGCHGYPTSALTAYTNASLGSDTYLRQNFQKGFIVWDVTKRNVAVDKCA